MYAQDSIDMLSTAGLQFKRHEEEGIELDAFAELLISSGLVLADEITWITFARCVGGGAHPPHVHTAQTAQTLGTRRYVYN